LETANDWNGKEEDEDIEGGVPGGVGVPEGRGFEAVSAFDGFVPVELDRGALEGRGESEGDEGRPYGVNCHVADGAEPRVASEDVEVEVEEGELGERDEHLVEDLVDVEVLMLSAGFQDTKMLIFYHSRHLDILNAIVLDQVLNVMSEPPPQHC
jgi:hypothetical protein